MEEQKKKLNIQLPPDVAEGTYANLSLVAHSASEFVIDFIRKMPGVPDPVVKSRIIMTPENTKELLAALTENVEKYEQTFGEIESRRGVQPDNKKSLPFGLGGKGDA